MTEKITAIIVLEMLGKPAEYLKETLNQFIERMSLEKGLKILKRKVNEPCRIDTADLLSSFAEVEIEFDNLQLLLNMIFTYMPSHIEVVSPESISLKNFEFNNLCNDLTRRLLEYDAIAKKMIYERRILENQLRSKGETPAIQEEKVTNKIKKKSIKKKKKRL
jgi:hypothetical protein